MEWNEETIARLRALWAEGLSTAEIGRRLNVSKNAVVGKAHRLNLSARPSPIRRMPSGAAPVRRPAVHAPVQPARTVAAEPSHAAEPPPAPAPRAVLRPVPPATGRVTACCWPIGEPGTRQFRFCDEPSAPGRPYCQEHVAVAYVKVRDRREEAA